MSDLLQSITKRRKLGKGNEKKVIPSKRAAIKERQEMMGRGKFRELPRTLGYMSSDPMAP